MEADQRSRSPAACFREHRGHLGLGHEVLSETPLRALRLGGNVRSLEEPCVLVHLMPPRGRQVDHVGQERAPHIGVVAEPDPRSPPPGGEGGLERIGQEHGGVRSHRPHGHGELPPRSAVSRIPQENVRHRLSGEERRPGADGGHQRIGPGSAQGGESR
jgi:hypothetical protein